VSLRKGKERGKRGEGGVKKGDEIDTDFLRIRTPLGLASRMVPTSSSYFSQLSWLCRIISSRDDDMAAGGFRDG
jgi:hypothetical protein